MGEAEVGDVVGELVGELEVRERRSALERVAAPRAEVHLVDRDRRRSGSASARRSSHSSSSHSVLRTVDDRRVARRHLRGERERVGLQADAAVPAVHRELVVRAGRRPPARRAPRLPSAPSERIGCSRPSQKLKSPTTLTERAFGAHTANAVPATPSISRTCAPSRSYSCSWRPSVAEVEVELAERRQERVRVAQRVRVPVRVLDLELVVERQRRLREQRLPQARGVLQLRLDAPGCTRTARASGRYARTTTPPFVWCAPSVRVRVRAELDHDCVVAGSISRWIPATGIPTQSGRLSSS